MMRSSIVILAMALAAAAFAPALPLCAADDLPPAQAEAFWTYITDKNPYEEWDMWPGYDGIYPGKSPHGAYLKLYANPVALKAARAGEKLPPGSILVKENYGKDKKTLMAVTPMYKVKGYNPDAGDWFWAKYGPKGEAAASGKVKSCIDCHRAGQVGDFIFTAPK